MVATVSGLGRGVVEVVVEGAAVVKGEVAASEELTVVVTWFHHVLRDNKGVFGIWRQFAELMTTLKDDCNGCDSLCDL